ncbi:DUF4406 domain-containing protein [Mucilaginibacter ximonensis]|uniref:DUF4406 domain-containing protein n=1 Tax=Mucilaginibacter ximonensis TaxID=538021 RepID=A0ABW5YFC3_9SPHI
MDNKIQFLIKLATAITKSKKHVAYVAGKVTGLEPTECYLKFKAAQAKLEADGWTVLNPCDFIKADEDWQMAMRFALPLLCMADTIYLLPDWMDSEGARIEFEIAQRFGLNVVME